jgi:hypothetical protein
MRVPRSGDEAKQKIKHVVFFYNSEIVFVKILRF